MVITVNTRQNPLANCGNIVIGERFVGRRMEMETIQNKILVKNGGNIAIMGLHRVGKSSLAWNALLEQRTSLLDKKIFVIRKNVGDMQDRDDFYRMLLSCTLHEIEDVIVEGGKDLLKEYELKVMDKNAYNIEKKESIWKFFKFLARNNINIIFILDEFDYIGEIFQVGDFQFIRELSTNPETNISLATISRRTIYEIELLNGAAISKLSTAFSDLNLGFFTYNDMNDYWEKLRELDIDTDIEFQKKVHYYTGTHPFLVDTFNSEIINKVLMAKKQGSFDINSEINNIVKFTIMAQYDYIISLIQEENLHKTLQKVFLGQIKNMDYTSVIRLEKFGIIYDLEGTYECFAPFFKEYWLNRFKLESDEKIGENSEKHIFLSYSHTTNGLADKLETVFDNEKKLILLRDQSNLKYKDDIDEFMQTIETCNNVIMVVSDGYIKSKYCMREAMLLFKDSNFKSKIIPLIDSGGDSIYNGKNYLRYIKYWQNEKDELQMEFDGIDLSNASLPQKELVEIKQIIDFLEEFISYVQRHLIQPIKQHIDEEFKTVIEAIKK